MPSHFLDLSDFSGTQLRGLLDRAKALKREALGRPRGAIADGAPLAGRMVALIFQQPSTRTRISFEVAIHQLGGTSMLISGDTMQTGRGESLADTARVLSRYVDAIMLRARSHDDLIELSRHATVPVINGLTNLSHPCQIMADIQTIEEHRGPFENQRIAWVGDGNNVASSFVHAAARLGGHLRIATPKELALRPEVMAWARAEGAELHVCHSADEAVTDATCVITDAWVSMHDTDVASRHNLLRPYQVNAELMKKAAKNAIFMHCLPAHRGEEVTADVIDGPQSVVFDEAENRLHAQKAILLHCLGAA
jgi:ornithine carbamoyltransferase